MDENQNENYSPPSSPGVLLSSPLRDDDDALDEDFAATAANSSRSRSSSSSHDDEENSPQSSPLRKGVKRRVYAPRRANDTLKSSPTHSTAKKRRASHSKDVLHDSHSGASCSSDGHFSPLHEEDGRDECIPLGPGSLAHLSAVVDDGDLDRNLVGADEVLLCNASTEDSNSSAGSDIGSDDDKSDKSNSSEEMYFSAGEVSEDGQAVHLGEQESVDSDHEDPFSDVNLYSGCEKTTNEAIYELISIYLCNNLSLAALKDTLKFYTSSLPPDHNMPTSHHLLLNRVKEFSVPLFEIEHYYCRPKIHTVASRGGPCEECGSTDIGIFYELPLEKRMQYLFEHRGLADLIDAYAAVRMKYSDGNIRDIVDGSEFLRISSIVIGKYKVTMIINTDGISPYKSSKAKFWPLLFTFMEISPQSRSSFTILWGLWFDKKLKPDMNVFLKPFVESLLKIAEEGGVSWKHPKTGEVHKSPVSCPLLIADAPARADCLNMQEHNAKYACLTCGQKTVKLPALPTAPGQKKVGRKRRFLFQEQPSQLRTHEGMIEEGEIGTMKDPKRGHKGQTVIKDIPLIDLSTCVLSEYMHCVLLGVVRQICTLWFFVAGDWCLADHLPDINEFLSNEVHPPDFVSRLPRSLEYFKFFKANEFRSFLLYYSLIVVSPYLKQKYLQNWILFVQATFLLLSDSISETDLVTAEVLIRLFMRDLGALYGDTAYVYNVHQLCHLVLYVRRWGPLWATSTFSFENFNGILARMLHGSQNEGRELINQLFLAQGAQFLKNEIVSDATTVRGIRELGKPLNYCLSNAELDLLSNLKVDINDIKFFGRIVKGRETFSSQQYDRHFKRRNSYIQFQVGGRKKYGRIAVFCKSNEHLVCLVQELQVNQRKFFFHNDSRIRIKHLIPVEDSGNKLACEITSIQQKLIQVGDFLSFRPNTIESNL